MNDPSKPLRLKREGMSLYLANGYGPSAAYSSAGYSFKSREHLSKNAATLAANAAVKSRVLWLQERPQEAASLLRQWNAHRQEAEAQERVQSLAKAVTRRKEATARRETPKTPDSPVSAADETSLLDLLHFCQSEAKAIYERAKLERADPMIIKNALSCHRDFTVSLQKYRDEAKQVAHSPASAGEPFTLQNLYANICEVLAEPAPAHRIAGDPVFATVEETEASHDETELRYNVAQTLNQYDLLVDASNRPDMRVQLQLLEVLAKSTQRLIALQAQRREHDKGRVLVKTTSFEINPKVVLRFLERAPLL